MRVLAAVYLVLPFLGASRAAPRDYDHQGDLLKREGELGPQCKKLLDSESAICLVDGASPLRRRAPDGDVQCLANAGHACGYPGTAELLADYKAHLADEKDKDKEKAVARDLLTLARTFQASYKVTRNTLSLIEKKDPDETGKIMQAVAALHVDPSFEEWAKLVAARHPPKNGEKGVQKRGEDDSFAWKWTKRIMKYSAIGLGVMVVGSIVGSILFVAFVIALVMDIILYIPRSLIGQYMKAKAAYRQEELNQEAAVYASGFAAGILSSLKQYRETRGASSDHSDTVDQGFSDPDLELWWGGVRDD